VKHRSRFGEITGHDGAKYAFNDLDAVEQVLADGLLAMENNPARIQSMTGFGWITSISMNASY